MATTAQNIVYDALKEIHVLAEGDVPSASMLDDALRALNRICDTYSNDQSFSPYANHVSWNLTGEQSFTIGAGNSALFTVDINTPATFTSAAHGLNIDDTLTLATTGALPTGLAVATTYYVVTAGFTANTFQLSATSGGTSINTSGTQSGLHTFTQTSSLTKLVTTRPIKIDTASVDRNGITYPVAVIDNQKWDLIVYKAAAGANTRAVYYESTSPVAIVHLWPVCTGCTLNLRVINQTVLFPTLATTLVMPPGYEEALIKLLAVNISPQYPAGTLSPITVQAANAARRYLSTTNNVIPTMQIDGALTGRRGGAFSNFLAGY